MINEMNNLLNEVHIVDIDAKELNRKLDSISKKK